MPGHLLEGLPKLKAVVELIDAHLKKDHPSFFGSDSIHPVLPLKTSKVVHDNLWGTNRLSWWELALIDSPPFQRLRDIHQTGLAFQVYPSARHTRFEHCLGVMMIASRTFDAIAQRSGGDIRNVLKVVYPDTNIDDSLARLRQEIRIAALLHDVGHSLFSHTSELVYQNLSNLKDASEELSDFAGKKKGSGEVLSFCFALTDGPDSLIKRARKKLISAASSQEYSGEIDLGDVAVLLIGRSRHPFLQFAGDIISSGFDADKLDYLLRDATAAGLPLRYDLERYLYAVRLEKARLSDGQGQLEALYKRCGAKPERFPKSASSKFAYYETYRLRLPKEGMNAVEQIVICKLMLFSYIYHHPKVRAAEGMLKRALDRKVTLWRKNGFSDEQMLENFLIMTDSAISGLLLQAPSDEITNEYFYRIRNRLLPREIYGINGVVASHAERALVTNFLTSLQDKKEGPKLIAALETAIGEELLVRKRDFAANPEDALWKAGVWVDVPKPPTFEDVDELVIKKTGASTGVALTEVFPIGEWTQAYTHFRYNVRIFAFSEYFDDVAAAAKRAMERVLDISGDTFYEAIRRSRS